MVYSCLISKTVCNRNSTTQHRICIPSVCRTVLFNKEIMGGDNIYDTSYAPFGVATYNCRGYNQFKEAYVRQLLSECNVLCLQEHWLSEAQIPVLSAISKQFLCTGVCGFNDSAILTGRPYGGCAVFWRTDIHAQVSVIDTQSRRIAAIKLNYSSFALLILSVYLPYDNCNADDEAFIDELFYIESIIDRHPNAHVIVCGDFNVDFSRNWRHTQILDDFCDRLSLSLQSDTATTLSITLTISV
jgi:hypothetical protein